MKFDEDITKIDVILRVIPYNDVFLRHSVDLALLAEMFLRILMMNCAIWCISEYPGLAAWVI